MGSKGGSPDVEQKLVGWAVQFYEKRFKFWWTAAIFGSSHDLKTCRTLFRHPDAIFRIVHANYDLHPTETRRHEGHRIAAEVRAQLRRKAVRA